MTGVRLQRFELATSGGSEVFLEKRSRAGGSQELKIIVSVRIKRTIDHVYSQEDHENK